MVSDLFDAVILTMGRGTPMADLLNNHAQNIRDSHSRALMEKAGRAEVRMMIPVIFLLLPISVLFALWPSFQQLQQMVVVA
jgi:tight adherence protein C